VETTLTNWDVLPGVLSFSDSDTNLERGFRYVVTRDVNEKSYQFSADLLSGVTNVRLLKGMGEREERTYISED